SLASPSRSVLVAGSAASALEYIREHDIALILLDLVLPDGDGRHLLMRLRESPRTAGIPVYMLSARTGEQPRTECFALGADGFFEKPLQLDSLAAAVAARLQRAGEAAFESRHDPLTGLPNRAAFYETFDRLRAMAMRERAPLSLGLADLDHMGRINETHGRVAGNEVLRRTASLLSMTLRDTDLVARWSGEEFALLLPRAGADAGRRALEKALQRVQEESFTGTGGAEFTASFTGGVVEVREGLSVEQLLNQADRLLYLGKSAGRSRVLAGDSMINPPPRRILLAEDDPYLAGAIERRLTREGFEVLHRPDGAAALQAAEQHPASLVIVDTEMPRMDGFALLARLRELPAYRETPVLMLTVMGSEAHIVRAFDAGADDYLLKPFASPELIARVRRLVTPH
ncbi:MAG: GGDEF domain-containing response regulator, partial [Gemmatimonadales bacterium]